MVHRAAVLKGKERAFQITVERVTIVYSPLRISPNSTTGLLRLGSDGPGLNAHLVKRESHLTSSQAPSPHQGIGGLLTPTHKGGVRFKAMMLEEPVAKCQPPKNHSAHWMLPE